jgi:hypothetical protein
MAADDLSPVSLPAVAPAGDAPPRDSRRRSSEKNDKKDKNDLDPENARKAEKSERRSGKPRDNKPPAPEADFERTEHEFDGFA